MKNNATFMLAFAGGLIALTLAGCGSRPPQATPSPTSSSAHASDANAQSLRVEQRILQTRSARTRMKRAAAVSGPKATAGKP